MKTTIEIGTAGIAQGLLEEFEREVGKTRRFLERIPDGRMAWRPHPKSMSAGQLGYHIAETPEMTLRFASKDRERVPDLGSRPEASGTGQLLEILDNGAAFVRQNLPALDDARMRASLTIELPDGGSIEVQRSHFIRSIMFNHWYHHRGQLGVYLRLLGASVPSAYGPSGDESGGM